MGNRGGATFRAATLNHPHRHGFGARAGGRDPVADGIVLAGAPIHRRQARRLDLEECRSWASCVPTRRALNSRPSLSRHTTSPAKLAGLGEHPAVGAHDGPQRHVRALTADAHVLRLARATTSRKRAQELGLFFRKGLVRGPSHWAGAGPPAPGRRPGPVTGSRRSAGARGASKWVPNHGCFHSLTGKFHTSRRPRLRVKPRAALQPRQEPFQKGVWNREVRVPDTNGTVHRPSLI